MSGVSDAVLVCARRVLLDAAGALGDHRDNIILIGAQAVYLRAGAADLGVAPYTEDAVFALDPRELGDSPLIEELMTTAGFLPGVHPGAWRGQARVVVDLLVPDSLVPPEGRRGARIPPHANHVARKASGLEASLVDWSEEPISALDPADDRVKRTRIAGPAALVIAKAHKIGDRNAGNPERLKPKDALDLHRLLVATPDDVLVSKFRDLLVSAVAGKPYWP